jgi:hypothetical protein
MSSNGEQQVSEHRPGRARRVFVAILVIIGCVLAPLSLFAVWTRNTVLDTDSYVSTVAPLAHNPQVIDAAATGVTERVMHATDLSARLTEALPPRAAKAAPAMTAAIKNVVYDGAVKILSSDQFAQIWTGINRRAHTQVVAALTGSGRGSKAVKLQNGAVVLDLTPLADRVRARITKLGFDVNAKVPGRVVNPKLVLFQSSYLGWTQEGVNALQKLAWILPVLMLLCFGGAIALSHKRRRTVLRAGLGIAAAVAVLLTAINLGRVPYLGLFPRVIGRQAGGAAYDQVLHSLRVGGRAVFVLGLIVAIGAWLAGPSASAVRLRSMVTGRERSSEPGPFAVWVGHAKVGLRVAVVALGAIALVAVNQPSGWTVLVIAVLVLVALGIIELIGRPARPVASSETG